MTEAETRRIVCDGQYAVVRQSGAAGGDRRQGYARRAGGQPAGLYVEGVVSGFDSAARWRHGLPEAVGKHCQPPLRDEENSAERKRDERGGRPGGGWKKENTRRRRGWKGGGRR